MTRSALLRNARRLRFAMVAAAAIVACKSGAGDADSADQASTQADSACARAKQDFLEKKTTWDKARATCDSAVDTYTSSPEQKVNFDWFKNSPLGLGGPPVPVLLAMLDLYKDVWPDLLGMGPHPDEDPVTSGARGTVTAGAYGLVYDTNPETGFRHAFFSCGGCHTGRYVGDDGKMHHVFGAPNSEIEAQLFGWRMRSSVFKIATPLTDGSGNYIYDDRGVPKYTVNIIESERLKLQALKHATLAEKAKIIPGWTAIVAKEVGLAEFSILDRLVMGAVRTDIMYGRLPSGVDSYSYSQAEGSPVRVPSRPGQMDAYGFASGLVFTHANRPEYFKSIKDRYVAAGADYKEHPFFKGITASNDEELFAKAKARVQGQAMAGYETDGRGWLPQNPAPVDIKSLFRVAERPNVGWDGNQATEARVIASGTSAVGDPWNVNLPIHKGMNDFIAHLPAAPYPFAVKADLAKQGSGIFQQECAGCHKPNNDKVYALASLGGIDENRAHVVGTIARAGVVELMREACDGAGNGRDVKQNVSLDKGYGLASNAYGGKADYDNDWCTPKGPNGEKLTLQEEDDMLYRQAALRDEKGVGYKADELIGVWAQAPYLHNGSIPTLWHLLTPEDRPAEFVRGNVNFDKDNVGFAWQLDQKIDKYEDGSPARTFVFKTKLRGQSNGGHTFGSKLTKDQKLALIEYLKTL